jgi:hypothetical protein
MLFLLDKSLLDAANQAAAPIPLRDTLEELAKGRRMGRLLLSAQSKGILEEISQLEFLTDRAKFIFHKCSERWGKKGDIRNRTKRYVRVIDGAEGISCTSPRANTIEVKIPFQHFKDTFAHAPILICENLSDAKLYLLITRCVNLQKCSIIKTSIHIDHRGGGGTTTTPEYAHIKAVAERFCVCITDSDIDYPGKPAPFCPIASALKNHEESNPSSLATWLPVDAHAAENYIPPQCLSSLQGYLANGPQYQAVELSLLQNISKHNVWKYFPGKKGISCKEMRSGSPLGQYWKAHLNLIAPPYSSKDCKNIKNLHLCTHSCDVFPSMLDSSLADFVSRYYSDAGIIELQKAFPGFPTVIQDLWINLAADVTSWACAGERIQT